MWNKLAEGLAWIFRLDGALAVLGFVFRIVADAMEQMAREAALFQAIIEASMVAVAYAFDRIMHGQFRNLGADMWSTFKFDVKDAFQKNLEMLKNPDSNMTASMVTNIGSVSIQNSFKEQLEPDRIAFTIRDQLLSASRNRTSASGQVMRNTGAKQ